MRMRTILVLAAACAMAGSALATGNAWSAPPEPAESGYGLLLVEESADRWGVLPGPFPCKTVWAEVELRLRR